MVGWTRLGGALILVAVALQPAGATGIGSPTQAALVPIPSYAVPACGVAPSVSYSAWTYAYPVAYAYPTAAPMIVTPTAPLAVPTPAPPSKPTAEPPLRRQVEMPLADRSGTAPTVVEARSPSGGAGTVGGDRCQVGFWNLSGRDVTLVVAGKAQVLARNRSVTLEVPHFFVWRVNAQPSQTEHIAADQISHEIVIR